jgi:hypothetical protein
VERYLVKPDAKFKLSRIDPEDVGEFDDEGDV